MTHFRLHRLLTGVALAAFAGCAATPAAPGPVTPPPERETPHEASWDEAALAELAAYVGTQNSTGLIVMRRGETVLEAYWPLPDTAAAKVFRDNFTHGTAPGGVLIEDVASLQKSLIALLAGIAVDKGLLDPAQTVSSYIGPGWSKAKPDQEAAITVRNLLEMNSGLGVDLSYAAPPGEVFLYNTPAYAVLHGVLGAAADAPLAAITRDWLTAPLGLAHTGWEKRPEAFAGVGNPYGLVSTPRDLALIGEMVANEGRSGDGRQIISADQLKLMLTPTATNPAYGRLWWLNGGAYSFGVDAGASRTEGAFIPAAPADLVAGLGAMDRQVFVSPSLDLVVVRTGMETPDKDFRHKLWEKLIAALPAD